MSEKSTKEVVAENVAKVAIGLGTLVLLKNFIGDVFDPPGLTNRVKYDYTATQKKKIYLSPGQWYEVDDPWTPADLARQLHTAMSGGAIIQPGQTDRSVLWEKLSQQGNDRLRWLHNYWLDNIDSEHTIFRWIDREMVLEYTEEHDRWKQAKERLTRAGVGF